MTPPPRWRLDRPGRLGAVETALKLPAVALGLTILVQSLGDDLAIPDGGPLVAWVVMLALCLGLAAAVPERLIERELVALAFIGPNLAAHLGLLLGLMADRGDDLLLISVGLLFAGDGTKLLAIGAGELRSRRAGPTVLAALTGAYAVGYLATAIITGL